MNARNRKINVQAELSLAGETWKEAEILFAQRMFKGCISRLYYAAFHSARALLLSKGFDPSSHKGVLHLLQLHFIKAGLLDTTFGRIFSKAQKFREESDYLPAAMFSESDAAAQRDEVGSFLKAARQYLRKGGFAE